MSGEEKSLFLLSDVNLDFLKRNIELSKVQEISSVYSSEYNSFKKIFLTGTGDSNFDNSNYLFIWQSPEAVSDSFSSLKNFDSFSEEEFINDINNYVTKIKELSTKFDGVLIPLLTSFDFLSDIGLGNMNALVGYDRFINKANSILIEELENTKNIYILDPSSWFKHCSSVLDYKLWLRAKIPFSIELMKHISESIISSIKTIQGTQKKLLVLDLDNTLWGGIVGDDGWENIKVGGHDMVGEAYLAFQKEIK